MQPVYGVLFKPGVPIALDHFGARAMPGDGPEPSFGMNCTEVRSTDFGMLQLVPKAEAGVSYPTLFVPPDYILYMIRADDAKTIGFLPAN